jgi:photosystem II stability/assembly factor-like uncharacterized protein
MVLVAVAAATFAVVASSGALEHNSSSLIKDSHQSPVVVRWRVPHGEASAPIVPVAGGSLPGQGGYNAVSCPTTSVCVAVGADASLDGVASTSNDGGGTWVQGAMALGEPELLAVDCPSATSCVAVGRGAAVASSNAGSTWTSASLPTPNTTLLGVSCPTQKFCVSVGVSPSSSGPYNGRLLVSSNGGSSWTASSIPAGAGALGSVDCPSATFCVAVGASIIVSDNSGKTWTLKGVEGGTGVLRSVSCVSATTCVAIGPNPTEAQDLQAAAYDVRTADGGATWTTVSMPVASGSLNVITCVTGSSCEAAGSVFGANPSEFYTTSNGGGTWTQSTAPTSVLTGVSGVSCASSSTCVYVGSRGGSSVIVGDANQVWTSHSLAPRVRTQRALYR